MPIQDAVAKFCAELRPMRHLWVGVEGDLMLLGINSLADLRERDPDELFAAYCAREGRDHDPCVRDIFAALVAFAKTGEPRAWWRFTRERSAPLHFKFIDRRHDPITARL